MVSHFGVIPSSLPHSDSDLLSLGSCLAGCWILDACASLSPRNSLPSIGGGGVLVCGNYRGYHQPVDACCWSWLLDACFLSFLSEVAVWKGFGSQLFSWYIQ